MKLSSGNFPGRSTAGRTGRVGPWVVLSLAVVAVLVWVGGRWLALWPEARDPTPKVESPPPDPRLTYTGPYRNIHPSVNYVGDSACVGCHPFESEGFHRHPMGRSIVPIAKVAASQRYDGAVHNPFAAVQSRFTVERQGDRVWHKQEHLGPEGKAVAAFRTEVEFAIGSGQRGHSYFTTRGGFLFQTAISWYSQKQIWDLSPGFANGRLRPVIANCLFCHSSGVRPIEGTANRYAEPVFTSPAIGCERCHGPGEVHVKERRADTRVKGRIDHTIVNPRHLPAELRENVCQQCHLEGVARVIRRGRGLFDYRPGLPLHDFWTIFVRAKGLDDERKAVSHVEQMVQSKCFKVSGGKLGCITCHDPHEPLSVPQRVPVYRNKCLECHATEHPCSLARADRLKQSKEDSCIACHMTRLRSSDIVHVATTDHAIPRKPRLLEAQRPVLGRPALPEVPLVPFHARPEGDPDADRDLGMAMVEAARIKGGAFSFYLPQALRLIGKASQRDPKDIALLERENQGLTLMGKKEQALKVCQRLLSLAPNHEQAATDAALLCVDLRRFEDALKYWDKIVSLDPWRTDGYLFRAALLARAGQYTTALAECRKLSDRDPLRAEPWAIGAFCHEQLGQQAQARKDRARVEALKTADFEPFRLWFASVLLPTPGRGTAPGP